MQGRFKMEYRLFTIVRYNYKDYNRPTNTDRHNVSDLARSQPNQQFVNCATVKSLALLHPFCPSYNTTTVQRSAPVCGLIVFSLIYEVKD